MDPALLDSSRYEVVAHRLGSSLRREWLVAAATTLAFGGLLGAFALAGTFSPSGLDGSSGLKLAIQQAPPTVLDDPDDQDDTDDDDDESEEDDDTADESHYDEHGARSAVSKRQATPVSEQKLGLRCSTR